MDSQDKKFIRFLKELDLFIDKCIEREYAEEEECINCSG